MTVQSLFVLCFLVPLAWGVAVESVIQISDLWLGND
jgi:hypothetical protein